MDGRDYFWLLVILVLGAWAIWMAQNEQFPVRRGLDLQGGLQVLLEADLPEEAEITAEQMDTSRQIIEQRVNALGVAEPLVQVELPRRVLVELPGIDNPDDAFALIQETALLEFVDTGPFPLTEGTCVRTTENDGPSRCEFAPGQPLTSTLAAPAPTYETIMTGTAIQSATADTDGFSFYVNFILSPEARDLFADYTRENQGNFLTIVLDKQVISAPKSVV